VEYQASRLGAVVMEEVRYSPAWWERVSRSFCGVLRRTLYPASRSRLFSQEPAAVVAPSLRREASISASAARVLLSQRRPSVRRP
jgi:hypothetical protein